MNIKEKLLNASPLILKNLALTVFNTYQYKVRHGKVYKKYRQYYYEADNFSAEQLNEAFQTKKNNFFEYVKENSPWYKNYNFENLSLLPILEKSDLVNHIDKIKTIKEKKGIINFTGGTTGTSMKTIYTVEDVQERMAVLDNFRANYGYKLGKKAAWFSGRNIISEKDISKGICSHYNYINKIRFYSTFHISQKNFDIYWNSLAEFKPEFIIGFPSSVYEICRIAESKGLILGHKVKVFFPTAETVLPQHRETISKVLGCKVVNQYASSEGAPFILECKEGRLHIHPLTGMFEVVDENLKPTTHGELLVTSFNSKGTPLIRYRIGDRIKLGPTDTLCTCGSIFPLVEAVEGRSNDYVVIPGKGRIFTVNLIDSIKGVKDLLLFQVIQEHKNELIVKVVVDQISGRFQDDLFVSALRERVGNEIKITLQYVDDIKKESSGKFKLVKNLLEK